MSAPPPVTCGYGETIPTDDGLTAMALAVARHVTSNITFRMDGESLRLVGGRREEIEGSTDSIKLVYAMRSAYLRHNVDDVVERMLSRRDPADLRPIVETWALETQRFARMTNRADMLRILRLSYDLEDWSQEQIGGAR